MNLRTLYLLSYGLYLVGSRKGDKLNGQVANAVFQVTSEPPRLAICLNKQNLTHEFVRDSKVFTVSVLRQDTPLSFIGLLGFQSGRDVDKLKDVSYRIGEAQAPIILDNALGYLEAKVVGETDVGTHTIFVGEVVAAEVIGAGEPMTYAYYHQIKGGTTPPKAPVYVEERRTEPLEQASSEMARYQCSVCGYVYDPEKGDPDGGIAPGTPFEQLSEDWVCPVCGAAKSMFEKA